MEKRYQVFISSTYEDLRAERKEIIENLLNAKYVPSGMEMFTASNEEQFKYIKKIIDDCDYYVLVLGGRYGSINSETGKSFTEMEYDYAREKDIPILAFVQDKPYDLPSDKREHERIDLFDTFRNKVLTNSKMSKFWTEKSDLISSVIISLVQIVDECPRIGWVRGEHDFTTLLEEINSLRIENKKMLEQNENMAMKNNELLERLGHTNQMNNLACGGDIFIGKGQAFHNENIYNPEYCEYIDETISDGERKFSITWNNVLISVAPEIFSYAAESVFRNSLDSFLSEQLDVEQFSISKRDYNIIKYQLIALGLIEYKKVENKDYIGLTDQGKKQFINVITIKK